MSDIMKIFSVVGVVIPAIACMAALVALPFVVVRRIQVCGCGTVDVSCEYERCPSCGKDFIWTRGKGGGDAMEQRTGE